MPVIGETVLPQYPSVEAAAKSDRVLIVAPHMDDEAIGAGAYALDAIRSGAEVFVAFLTAGDCARFSARIMHGVMPKPSDYVSVGLTRIAEARRAMRILGVPQEHIFVLGYPDRGLRTIFEQPSTIVRSTSTEQDSVPYEAALSPGATHTLENVVADLRRVLDLVRPTTVITPVPFDLHPDHSAAAEIVDLAIDRLAAHAEPPRIHRSHEPVFEVARVDARARAAAARSHALVHVGDVRGLAECAGREGGHARRLQEPAAVHVLPSQRIRAQ